MTAVTPSMVTELSATLVERMTFGRSAGDTARSCSAGERSPWRGRTSRPNRDANGSMARAARRISAAPGRNTSTSPPTLRAELERRSSAAATCSSSGAGECGVYSIARSYSLPSDRRIGQPPRILGNGRGIESRRHDDQSVVRESSKQRQSQIGIEMPLVELVQDHRADAGQRGIGQQPPRQHALGQESQARARAADVLETHLIADGFTDALAEFAGDTPGSQACG